MIAIVELINWEFAIRLAVAGVCGIAIGLEREYRAKEAGYRTHFLVCVGSALMMIISKYAFWDLMQGDFHGVKNVLVSSDNISKALSIDPARIAAGVVTGIGFLGAGTIILHKQAVRGLTTAAGIWATGGIGLAVGAGMYWESVAATILVLAGLELLSIFFRGLNVKTLNIEFEIDNKTTLQKIEKLFSNENYTVISYIVNEKSKDNIIIDTVIKIRRRSEEKVFFAKLTSLEGLTLHRIE